jgi:hypothetical protein
MRKYITAFLVALAVLAGATSVQAQSAHDACSESHTGTTGSVSEASFSWTHTPVGTPRGVVVWVFNDGGNTDESTGVTYDSEAVSAQTGGVATHATAEVGHVKTYFKGSSVNTGAVTVVVNRNNNSQFLYAIACTVTAGGDTEVHEAGIVLVQETEIDLDEQNVTDGSPGTDSVRYAAVGIGLGSLPAAGANSTLAQSIDPGNENMGVVFETTAGQGSRPVGFDYGGPPDDAVGVFLAIRQAGGGGATPKPQQMLFGVGGE